MISFDQFKNEWLGRVVDYDHVYQYQCVDLILEGLYEMYGIASGVTGNAIDYWVKTGINGFNQVLLTKFNKIASSEAQKGDIVVLNGLSGNPDGHIGWATGNIDATDVEILEQNGQDGSGSGVGGNAIRVRYIARSRVAGLLRPISQPATSAPAPAASTPSGNTVYLAASVATWAAYKVGSGLRKGTSDQVGSLLPSKYGGLSYPIVSWVGNYAVVIDTSSYGRVAIWTQGTSATFGNATPVTAAPAPAATVHPYTIEQITPKQIKINKDTHEWGLNYDNFTAINKNPQAPITAGSIVTVSAILHHNIGYNYYLPDPNVASGYNVVDCDDYTPPPPAPTPNPAPPAGPLQIPSSETYEVIKDVDGYQTSNQAVNHVSKKVTIPAGTYFVYNKRFDTTDTKKIIAYNLTKTPGTPGAWMNTLDNVEQPVAPAAPIVLPPTLGITSETTASALAQPDSQPVFADTFKAFDKPLIYMAMRVLTVADLSGVRKNLNMPQYSVTYIAGTFVVNGVEYARPKTAVDKGWWYGIPWIDRVTNKANIELESEVYNDHTSIDERQITKNLKIGDYLVLVFAHLHNFLVGIPGFLSKIGFRKQSK